MQSPQTPETEPLGSEPRQGSAVGAIPGAFRRPVSRTMLLTRAGVIAARQPAIRPLPELPDGTPPSVALKAVKGCGNPHASYKRHVGPRQVERAQRQAAHKTERDARRGRTSDVAHWYPCGSCGRANPALAFAYGAKCLDCGAQLPMGAVIPEAMRGRPIVIGESLP